MDRMDFMDNGGISVVHLVDIVSLSPLYLPYAVISEQIFVP